MPNFVFNELPNSRDQTAEPPTINLRYKATGTQSDSFVRAYAYSATPNIYPTEYGTLYRQDIRLEPQGFNVWTVTIPYARKGTKPPTGQWTFSFDTTGGSFHIKASKETVNSYGTDPPDFKQLIGVNGDDVAGADIVIPALKLNVTFKHPMGVVTIAYAKTLARLTGKVNDSTFLTCDAGEVLYLGSTGSDGSEAEAEVGYQFAAEENLQNQVIGAITGIQKDGWDIAWIKWKDAVDGGLPVKQPEWVYTERVYERVDLASALGFGG
jgi:hypothetical protein